MGLPFRVTPVDMLVLPLKVMLLLLVESFWLLGCVIFKYGFSTGGVALLLSVLSTELFSEEFSDEVPDGWLSCGAELSVIEEPIEEPAEDCGAKVGLEASLSFGKCKNNAAEVVIKASVTIAQIIVIIYFFILSPKMLLC